MKVLFIVLVFLGYQVTNADFFSFRDPTKVKKSGDTMTGTLTVTEVNVPVISSTTITLKGDVVVPNAKKLTVTGITEAQGGVLTNSLNLYSGTTLSSNFTDLNFGLSAHTNHTFGIGIGYEAYGNHIYGVGIGNAAYDNHTHGVGVGHGARGNNLHGVGIGHHAHANYSGGIGIGVNAFGNRECGIGIGRDACRNPDYAIGIGAYSQDNKPYSTSIGGYTFSASSSVSLGWNARSEAVDSISLGAGARTTAPKSVSIGAYIVNHDTATIKLGYKTVAPIIEASTIGVASTKLYGDGSALTNLPIGWEKIVDTNLGSGTAFTISGLNGNVDEIYHLIFITTGTITEGYVSIRFNADTGANYSRQIVDIYDATVSASRFIGATSGRIGYARGGYTTLASVIINAKAGNHRNGISNISNLSPNVQVGIYAFSWNNITDNLTSMTIISEVGSPLFDVRVILFRRKG